jgi:hypothetical protein
MPARSTNYRQGAPDNPGRDPLTAQRAATGPCRNDETYLLTAGAPGLTHPTAIAIPHAQALPKTRRCTTRNIKTDRHQTLGSVNLTV